MSNQKISLSKKGQVILNTLVADYCSKLKPEERIFDIKDCSAYIYVYRVGLVSHTNPKNNKKWLIEPNPLLNLVTGKNKTK